MDKPANPDHEVHALVRDRWSPRAFSDAPVSDATLRSVLEAARWAPSCFNEQPWRFVVTRRGSEAFDRFVACLAEKNQLWASKAPVLMLSVGGRNFRHNDKPNRHHLHDVGLAVATLTLQATSMGLFVHQMAGYSVEGVREAFGIPEAFEPAAAIALGYPGAVEGLHESLREAEVSARKRRPQAEFVFGGRWDEAL